MRRIRQLFKTNFLGRVFLALFSVLYGFGFWLHYFWQKIISPKRLPYPVLSIGNLTTGGTGKTLFCWYLSQGLIERGFQVCVLTRGYKGADEAKLLEEELRLQSKEFKVLVGADRYKLASQFLNLQPTTDNRRLIFILDDGHQHWELCRDKNILLVNAMDAIGLKHLLPLGLLREPLSLGLKRADVVILTFSDLVSKEELSALAEKIRLVLPNVDIFYARHKPRELVSLRGERLPCESLRSQKVVLFSGIGNPEGFEATVSQKLKARVLRHFVFEDHACYRGADLEEILNWAKRHETSYVLTTPKDAVRIKGLLLDIFVLHVAFEFLEEEERFWGLLGLR